MFPVETKIINCEFSSKRTYTAELRLKCRSKDDFKVWLKEYEKLSGNTYRVAKTIPRTGQKVLHKVSPCINCLMKLHYMYDIGICAMLPLLNICRSTFYSLINKLSDHF